MYDYVKKKKAIVRSAFNKQYNQTHKRFVMVLNTETDADVIEWIKSHGNVSDCLRELVRREARK